ncbi:MAG TPA: ATP-binding protein [Dissulfurispiraceae bacterium]
MREYPRDIVNSLAFRTIIPVIAAILLMGLGLHVFVLRAISGFADGQIKEAFGERSHDIYRICDEALNDIIKTGRSGDEKALRIKKALTVGTIEDFMRQNSLKGLVLENGNNILSSCCLPPEFSTSAASGGMQHTVVSRETGGKKYYIYSFRFEPWNWDVVLVKDAAEYSTLIQKVRYAYSLTGVTLLVATLMLLYYLNSAIEQPVKEIIRPLEKGERPGYRGSIKEFGFINESIRRTMDSLLEKEAEKERLMQQIIQEQKLESVGLLANGIAHNFNNILVGVLGYASLLRIRMEEAKRENRPFEGALVDEALKYIDTIENAAQRASTLAGELAGLAKGKRSEAQAASPVDIGKVVGDLHQLLVRTFPKNIEIQVSMPGDLPRVKGDISQLRQALLNICLNSKDAMPGGGRLEIAALHSTVVEKSREFPYLPPGDYAAIIITDTGMGIDEEKLSHIFEPFFTTKSADKSTGLGLSIAHTIIKAHDGHVSARSVPGKETSFAIHLPLLPS